MSSTTLLLIHKIAVTAFFVHYLVKAILLLFAKKETLEKYSRPTKPLEMLLALAFLATGVWLLTMKGQVSKMLIIKLVLVFSSIPIGVIAFKKGKRAKSINWRFNR